MTKRDGRAFDHKTLEAIRIRAVQRIEEDGETPSEVMRALGFARTVVYNWLAKYRTGGLAALRSLPIPGRPPKLTEQQRAWVYLTVTQNNPLQLQFEFALWTRAMVRELIERQYGVTLSLASVGRLLRVTGSDAPTAGPAGDRTGGVAGAGVVDGRVSRHPGAGPRGGGTDFLRGRGGGAVAEPCGPPRGPCRARHRWCRRRGKRFGLNLVSAVSPRGVLRFMVVNGRMTAVRFIEFLKRLLHNQTCPIYLIVDQHSTHRARALCRTSCSRPTAACGCSSCRRTPRNSTPMNSSGII